LPHLAGKVNQKEKRMRGSGSLVIRLLVVIVRS